MTWWTCKVLLALHTASKERSATSALRLGWYSRAIVLAYGFIEFDTNPDTLCELRRAHEPNRAAFVEVLFCGLHLASRSDRYVNLRCRQLGLFCIFLSKATDLVALLICEDSVWLHAAREQTNKTGDKLNEQTLPLGVLLLAQLKLLDLGDVAQLSHYGGRRV